MRKDENVLRPHLRATPRRALRFITGGDHLIKRSMPMSDKTALQPALRLTETVRGAG